MAGRHSSPSPATAGDLKHSGRRPPYSSPGSQVPYPSRTAPGVRSRTPVAPAPQKPPEAPGAPKWPKRAILEGFSRASRAPPRARALAAGGDAGQSQVPYPNIKGCIWWWIPRSPILPVRTPIPLLRTLIFRSIFAKILGFFCWCTRGKGLAHLAPCFTGQEALRANPAQPKVAILLTTKSPNLPPIY